MKLQFIGGEFISVNLLSGSPSHIPRENYKVQVHFKHSKYRALL